MMFCVWRLYVYFYFIFISASISDSYFDYVMDVIINTYVILCLYRVFFHLGKQDEMN